MSIIKQIKQIKELGAGKNTPDNHIQIITISKNIIKLGIS